MLQTFHKTINGHTIEFNRLLFPVRYNVLDHDLAHYGKIYLFEKDSKGIWNSKQKEPIPEWLEEISLEVRYIIQNNEDSLAEAECTVQAGEFA